MGIKENRKYAENKVEIINRLTDMNFYIDSYGTGSQWLKSDKQIKHWFVSRNLDELGDNLDDFLELHNKIVNRFNDLVNEGIEE